MQISPQFHQTSSLSFSRSPMTSSQAVEQIPAIGFEATLAQPKFGCRLLSFYSGGRPENAGETQEERSKLRHALFVTARDSFLSQSQGDREPTHRITMSDDLYTDYRKRGNHDGWGMVAYDRDSNENDVYMLESRSKESAATDNAFKAAIETTLKEHASVVMAHVRQASEGCEEIQLSNTHPYIREGWSWMHNGLVNGALTAKTKRKIADYEPLLGYQPDGTTDTEHTFHLFLGNLKKQFGSVDAEKIGIDNVRKVFAQTLREVLVESTPIPRTLNGTALGVKGRLLLEPTMNFVVSNGDFMMAFRKNLKLFLGEKTLKNGEKEYIIASEPIGDHAKTGVHWLELDQESLLTLKRNDDGSVTRELYSLKELAPETLKQRLIRLIRATMVTIRLYVDDMKAKLGL